jgi:hypothetical protein
MTSDAPIAESRLADSADRKYEPRGLLDGSKMVRIVGRSPLLRRLPSPRDGLIHEAVPIDLCGLDWVLSRSGSLVGTDRKMRPAQPAR